MHWILISIVFFWLVTYLWQKCNYGKLYYSSRDQFGKISMHTIRQINEKVANFLEDKIAKWDILSKWSYLIKYEIIKREIESLQNIDEKIKLLDVGCGDGYFLNLISQTGLFLNNNLYGIDIAKRNLEIVKKRLPNSNIYWGMAENLPFRSSSFDIVVSTECLEHLINPKVGFKEIIRVANSNIFITVPSIHPIFIKWWNPITWIEAVLGLYYPNILPKFHNLYNPYDKNHLSVHYAFSKKEIQKWLEKLDRIDITSCNYLSVVRNLYNLFKKLKLCSSNNRLMLQCFKTEQTLLKKIPVLNSLGKTMVIKAWKREGKNNSIT